MKTIYVLIAGVLMAGNVFCQNANTYFNRGSTKYYNLDYKGAIEEFTKVIELNPRDAKAYLSRGLSKYFLQDYAGDIADQLKAIEINLKYGDAYFNIGDA